MSMELQILHTTVYVFLPALPLNLLETKRQKSIAEVQSIDQLTFPRVWSETLVVIIYGKEPEEMCFLKTLVRFTVLSKTKLCLTTKVVYFFFYKRFFTTNSLQ